MAGADRGLRAPGDDVGLIAGGMAPPALLVAGIWWPWPRSEKRGLAALVSGFGLTALLWSACIHSLHMPIFRLGASVG